MRHVLRDYQDRSVGRTLDYWATGRRAVCLVAPTGSGKTVMGIEIVGSSRTVWVAHRVELIKQAGERFEASGVSVGYAWEGLPADPDAQVQIGTIQTLLARELRPTADLLVLDEAHHYAEASPDWHSLLAHYPNARLLGLTATPERRDGSPLGDVFDALVEAASYSELVLAGHLTECHVYAAPEGKPGNGWSADPIDAYRAHALGTRAFFFLDRVERAHEWAAKFSVSGIPAAVISGKTPKRERSEILERFAAGELLVLVNVGVLTEGIDIPSAESCILGRCPEHASSYIQMVGRILRPSPETGKQHATLIDLVDATHKHGYPTEDRRYSLEGTAIELQRASALSTCQNCGAVYPSAPTCPRCGFVRAVKPPPPVAIYDLALRRVYAGKDTPDDAKSREWNRLLELVRNRRWSLSWAFEAYQKLFFEPPSPEWLALISQEERRAFFERDRDYGVSKGWKPGYPVARYINVFGSFPPRDWQSSSEPHPARVLTQSEVADLEDRVRRFRSQP